MSNIQTSPKKARKPQARTKPLWDAILTVAAEYERMSVRQLFYQLVSRRAVEKTEAAYKRVCDISAQMRLAGALDYRKIVDGHRSRRVGWQFDSLTEALENTHELYKRNYWLEQPAWVEIWCEKDALTGVIEPICRDYGVPYVATRGFPSITLMYESAMQMKARGKDTRVYYFGDHDASGRAISANLERDMRAHGAWVTVERVALEPSQIEYYDLPTRPGKASDSRHAKFAERYGDASVELDALPPNVLEQMVRQMILGNIDREVWRRTAEIEALERETLASIAAMPLKPGTLYTLGS
mgnify:CR=1 FL=1